MEKSRIFKAQEAADYLRVHVETIRRLARKGEIPSFKVGRGWRFQKSELDEWTRANDGCSRNPLDEEGKALKKKPS